MGAIYLVWKRKKKEQLHKKARVDQFCLILPSSFCPQPTRKDFIVIVVVVIFLTTSVLKIVISVIKLSLSWRSLLSSSDCEWPFTRSSPFPCSTQSSWSSLLSGARTEFISNHLAWVLKCNPCVVCLWSNYKIIHIPRERETERKRKRKNFKKPTFR